MTERERLTERIQSAMCWGWTEPSEIAERLIDEGVIVPPCKVGDIIYTITYDGKDYIPFKASSRKTLVRWMDEDKFGSELFTAREEAEAALAEANKKQNNDA